MAPIFQVSELSLAEIPSQASLAGITFQLWQSRCGTIIVLTFPNDKGPGGLGNINILVLAYSRRIFMELGSGISVARWNQSVSNRTVCRQTYHKLISNFKTSLASHYLLVVKPGQLMIIRETPTVIVWFSDHHRIWWLDR